MRVADQVRRRLPDKPEEVVPHAPLRSISSIRYPSGSSSECASPVHFSVVLRRQGSTLPAQDNSTVRSNLVAPGVSQHSSRRTVRAELRRGPELGERDDRKAASVAHSRLARAAETATGAGPENTPCAPL